MKSKISITIDEGVLLGIDSVVDNIYIKNRSQAIEHLVRNALGESKSAVILLGGDESKLRLSSGVYRPLAIVSGKSVIEHAIRKLRECGFRSIHIVSRHSVMTRLFEVLRNGLEMGVDIHYIEEKKSLGTFESLLLLKGKIKAPTLIVYGDILFDKVNIDELWSDHLRQHPVATIMLTTSAAPSEKGTVKVEGSRVLEFTQKPKSSDIYLVFSPLFIAEPSLFEYEGVSLEGDIFPKLAERGLLFGHLSSEKERHIHSDKDVK